MSDWVDILQCDAYFNTLDPWEDEWDLCELTHEAWQGGMKLKIAQPPLTDPLIDRIEITLVEYDYYGPTDSNVTITFTDASEFTTPVPLGVATECLFPDAKHLSDVTFIETNTTDYGGSRLTGLRMRTAAPGFFWTNKVHTTEAM